MNNEAVLNLADTILKTLTVLIKIPDVDMFPPIDDRVTNLKDETSLTGYNYTSGINIKPEKNKRY